MRGVAWRESAKFAVRCLVCTLLLWPQGARAFDFLDLFGDSRPPPVSQRNLPYAITFSLPEGADLKQPLQEASTLYKLRQDAPVDGESLVLRASGDLGPMLDALWGAGYYNAELEIEVAGVHLQVGRPPPKAAAAAAEAYRGLRPVPIKVIARPGPLFRLRTVRITNAATGRPFSSEALPRRIVRIRRGDPARAADIRAARTAIVDWFRAQSHPLAKVLETRPVVYHRDLAMDVTMSVSPGPYADIGNVGVAGRSDVDPRVVRSYIYVESGDPYSPRAVSGIRKSVLQLPAISSVRVQEAKTLDANGQLPITVNVTDRKPRVVGFSARYSTLDGPAARAYWQHRNLFGGGESLRLEGEGFLPPKTYSSFSDSFDKFTWNDVGGRFRTSFVKPALQGSRNDLLLDGMVEKDRTGGDQFGGYSTRNVQGSAAIRHRFGASSSAQVGVIAEKGKTSDTLGTIDYDLVGVSALASYDSTDRPLDPTRGIRATASVAGYPTFFGSSVGLVESGVQASTYYAVDEEARLVLAGRVAAGSAAGESLVDIPANHRLYAGGGASVRGYRYRSLGPLGTSGDVIGGRSMFAASFEARWRVTETVGLVPFFDMGEAFRAEYPDFSQPLRYAAGVGFRYYTAVGPIRIDVAFPLNPRVGDDSYALYVGIGQAF